MRTGGEGFTMRISDEAFDLIVSEEVTSKAHYESKLKRTEWPGEASGVTVGIGYDLGQTDHAKIEKDWRGRVSDPMLSAMLSASGVTGPAANSLASTLKSSIEIPWDVALAVHRECVVPRWEGVVEKALPNTDKLPPDCFGALVSLTFNRGPSFSNNGDRYREMRAIKAHMAAGAFDKIPGEFRAMKRIWQGKGLDGLLRRRDAEADLFQRGLSMSPRLLPDQFLAWSLARRPPLPLRCRIGSGRIWPISSSPPWSARVTRSTAVRARSTSSTSRG